MSPATALAVALALVFVNACFVAAEYAFVTVRRSRVETLVRGGSRRARVLATIIDDLDPHVSAIQLAITSAGLAIGWLGEPAVAAAIGSLFAAVGLGSPVLLHTVSFVLAFAAITAVVVVLGELTPKFLGLRRTESVAIWMAQPVRLFATVTGPVLKLLTGSASLVLRLIGVGPSSEDEAGMDSDELRIFLSQLTSRGRISRAKRKLIENIFDFSEHTARQVMVPRDQIDHLSLERPVEENLAIIKNTEHTRYPLCESGLDGVVGMIHIKDLFHRGNQIQNSEDLRMVQHEMLFVPESQSLDILHRLFQRRRAHMAVVVDEYGVPTGLVTLEDVLEELVGEIQDEFDEDEKPQIIFGADGVQVDGMLLIEDLCRELNIELELEGVDVETVGGYTTNVLGKIAREGDRFNIANYSGLVTEMRGRRVSRVLLNRKSEDAGQDSSAGVQ